MKKQFLRALFATTCFATVGGAWVHSSQAAGESAVPVVADGIGGVVTSSKGPEAGVWVIAETSDLPTRFIKIVVTDDQGRYLLPELPKAKYKVWVRGYGLVDSKQIDAAPGKNINLTAALAPDAKAAAQYYPANYWFSLIHPPAASEFPGTGADGNGIAPRLKSQEEWIVAMKDCMVCHQQGDKATRELANNTPEGWSDRISQARPDGDAAVGNVGKGYAAAMQNGMAGFGRNKALAMWSDWTQRIAKGEIPHETPPRPAGVERNVVITEWDWGNGRFVHDIVASDRRNPMLNAKGLIYGSATATAMIEILDPVKNTVQEVPIPGVNKAWDQDVYAHNPMLDEKGRLWVTDNGRGRLMLALNAKGTPKTQEELMGKRPDFCANPADNAFAKYFPMGGSQDGQISVYDPITKKVTNIPDCFHTHHLDFGRDKDDTLYFTGDQNVIGWINTKVWDQTHDPQKAEGWCPMVLDTKEKGATKVALGDNDVAITPDRNQWNEPGRPADPKKDTRINSGSYGMDANPVDGSMWFASPGYPSGIMRFESGSRPPETCKTEFYQPPKLADGSYRAFQGRGISMDSKGLAWVAFNSGQVGSFDRSKCKVFNGPTATGQQCPEGWTFYDIPGPRLAGTKNVIADWYYLDWVDVGDTLGLGKDTPLFPGTDSDSIKAVMRDTGKIVTMTVPYPMGFFTRGMDGRIDDPKAGWKGRGLWSTYSDVPVWHQEDGVDGAGPEMVKFQVRPDPLAH